MGVVATDLLFLRDAYLQAFDATVTAVDADGRRVALDRTAFYATGGGQPHDTGTLAGSPVVEVRKEGDDVWHTLAGAVPAVGDEVEGEVDWDRRHQLMRTHTAMHILCGVVWNEWGTLVTGSNMAPLSARRAFAFAPLPHRHASPSSSPRLRAPPPPPRLPRTARATRQRRHRRRSSHRGLSSR